MTNDTSIRAVLFLVADLKKYVKYTKLDATQRHKLYMQLHDLIGELVLINYQTNTELEGGGTHGRLQHRR